MTSRSTGLATGLAFFTIGYIVVASSQSVENLAGGQVLYTIGNTGLNFGERLSNVVDDGADPSVKSVIIADLTNLQNRGLVNGLVTAPFIPNGFIAGFITSGISGTQGENWRWGVSRLLILASGVGLIAVRNVCYLDPNLDGSVYRCALLGTMAGKEAWSYGDRRSWVRPTTDFGSKQSSKASTRDSTGFVLAN